MGILKHGQRGESSGSAAMPRRATGYPSRGSPATGWDCRPLPVAARRAEKSGENSTSEHRKRGDKHKKKGYGPLMDLITTSAQLAAACARLATHPVITVDTEFLRETTYYPL